MLHIPAMIKPTIRRARAWLVMCTFAAACSGNETVDTAAMTGTSGMMSTTGTGGETWLPSACAGLGSPFLTADCLTALRDACRAQPSAEACAAQAPLLFSGGGYIIHCGWAKVVRFSDPAACTVAAVEGRCEAGMEDTLLWCGDRCSSEPTLHFSLHADSEAMELIEMPCASTESWLGGPLGPASAVGAEKGAFGSTCAPEVYPPAAPLCACGPVACAAG